MQICYWCREILGRLSINYQVDGKTQQFHYGLAKDCFNEFMKDRTAKACRHELHPTSWIAEGEKDL